VSAGVAMTSAQQAGTHQPPHPSLLGVKVKSCNRPT